MTDSDFPVGYKKPPKHTRFKPGQSGNPTGRPKGAKNLATDLAEELAQTIHVIEGGTRQTLTKQRAMIKTLFAKALKGDTRAANTLIQLISTIEQANQARTTADELSESDQAILEEYEARIRALNASDGGQEGES